MYSFTRKNTTYCQAQYTAERYVCGNYIKNKELCCERSVRGWWKTLYNLSFLYFSNGLHTLWSAALLTNTSAVPSCRLETAVASMPKRELRCASSFLPLLKSNLFTAFETSEQASPNWRLRDIIRQVKWMKKIFVQKRQR